MENCAYPRANVQGRVLSIGRDAHKRTAAEERSISSQFLLRCYLYPIWNWVSSSFSRGSQAGKTRWLQA